jgi:hypothetical protein
MENPMRLEKNSQMEPIEDIEALLEENGEVAPAYRILLTPDLARRFLRSERLNRATRARRITMYRSAMAEDGWGYTGQPLIFNRQGQMMDGGHRCKAVISANVSIEVLVVLGIEDAAFRFLDQGASRVGADFLIGTKNAAAIAAAVGWVWAEQKGTIGSAGSSHGMPPTEAPGMLQRHPKISESYTLAATVRLCLPGSIAIYSHYRATQVNPDAASEFFRLLASGAELAVGSPVLLLRNRLTENRRSKAKLPYQEIMALIIKAYALFLKGERIGALRWRGAGTVTLRNGEKIPTKAEDFPKWPAPGTEWRRPS